MVEKQELTPKPEVKLVNCPHCGRLFNLDQEGLKIIKQGRVDVFLCPVCSIHQDQS